MGTMRHSAVLVTTYDDGLAKRAHKKARRITKALRKETGRDVVTPLIGPVSNCYYSFAVLPSGSKVGWLPERMHEAACERFVAWLERRRFDDGSSPIDWLYVTYGDETHTDGHSILGGSTR